KLREDLDQEQEAVLDWFLQAVRRNNQTTLADVHAVFNEWMELDDTRRIDVTLAVALSNQSPDLEPLWLILIGPSGDGKTEQVRALRDPLEIGGLEEEASTKRISEITQNTLVSGMKGDDKDLAPKLEGKVILIYDFATILNLPSEAKRKVWGQLRELYDGEIGKQAGSGKDVDYKLDPPPSLIACSTPDIDNQIIQQQKLGTRELIYRLDRKQEEQVDEVLDQVLENHGQLQEMRDDLSQTVRDFLQDTEVDPDTELPDAVQEELKAQAKRLAVMRAQGDFDRYSNELMKDVSVEIPTRLVDQLKSLYICLTSLSEDYGQEKALSVIDKVVESSGEPRREKIFAELQDRQETNAYRLSQSLRVSQKMVERDLQVLWNLGIVDKEQEERDGDQDDVTVWRLNEDHKMVETLTDEPPLREKIRQVLREEDDGDGVYYSTIFAAIDEPEDKIREVLDGMLHDGEVFETPRAGTVKLNA
ncbi:MAG: hypothetical protein SVW02_04300, partial [Candidatus Nanohaloarchaea archaeon]|nr:hypothetical protein [Candidatus Nanohaloarchaea archaeon]